MWKSICSLLMIATACVPAEAARFSCKFAGNANPCMIDTLNQNGGTCQQEYPSNNLTATCEGDPSSNGQSQLVCYFSTGSQRPHKLNANGLSSSDNLAKALAEQPGYRTAAFEYITTGAVTILRVAYTTDTGFAADVACSPQ